MRQIEACLFSPFSPNLVKEENHRSLLLQFFLKELLAANLALEEDAPAHLIISSDRRHFPYDWAKESGHVNKAREHGQLLLIAFENFKEQVGEIDVILTELVLQYSCKEHFQARHKVQIRKKLHLLYLLIEPLISNFKNNENLIFFLLKNEDSINSLMGEGHLHAFLSHLHKKGLGQLEKRLSDHYHKRGFSSLVPELKMRISELSR